LNGRPKNEVVEHSLFTRKGKKKKTDKYGQDALAREKEHCEPCCKQKYATDIAKKKKSQAGYRNPGGLFFLVDVNKAVN